MDPERGFRVLGEGVFEGGRRGRARIPGRQGDREKNAMYMPMMIDVRRAVVFGGEREEGLQKTEKLAVFADDLLVVPETEAAPGQIRLEAGRLNRVPESLRLEEPRLVPVAPRAARLELIPEHVGGADFVTSDLEDPALNRAIYQHCEEEGILCNVIDVKELCNVWFMSVVDTENMLAGISTRGSCAFYAQRTRIELEEQFERRSEIARVFAELRAMLRDGQCNLCVLQVVYDHPEMEALLGEQKWDQALGLGVELVRDVPDGLHVMDHGVSPPEERKAPR